VGVMLEARAKNSVAEFEAKEELERKAHKKRRDLEKWRHSRRELRLQGDDEAIAEIDAHVSTIIDCGGLSELANALQSIPLRLSFENWKVRTIIDIEACLWRRCVTEFTRKNGFPPKPGSLWMLSSLYAELLREPKPMQLLEEAPTDGNDTEAAAAIATTNNRKALRGLRRDARKLANIRDKLEANEPPSELLERYLEEARPEDSWRIHVGGSDSSGIKQGDGGVVEAKKKDKSPSKPKARRRSSRKDVSPSQTDARIRAGSSRSRMDDSFKRTSAAL